MSQNRLPPGTLLRRPPLQVRRANFLLVTMPDLEDSCRTSRIHYPGFQQGAGWISSSGTLCHPAVGHGLSAPRRESPTH